MMDFNLCGSEEAAKWTYFSEGGANILFKPLDPPAEKKTKYLLRLRKSSTSPPLQPLPPLLPAQYLPEAHHVPVSQSFLKGLNDGLKKNESRPASRIGFVDESVPAATLVEDLIDGDGIVFEIKPKWGFLPSSAEYLSPSSAPFKLHHCRFCMHMQLKSIQTTYCPLDFFSPFLNRITCAVDALLSSLDDGTADKIKFRVWLDAGQRVATLSQLQAVDNQIARTLSKFIFDNRVVFDHIKLLQRSLDPFGIEHLFTTIPPPNIPQQPTTTEFTTFINLSSSADPLTWTDRQKWIAFLISTTYKDCSVLLRLPTPSQPEGSVKVIDLDPKPMDRAMKWFQLDREIWQAFEAAGANSKICVRENDEAIMLPSF